MTATMPRPSTLKLHPINLGKETIGQRIAKFRKKLGLTQVQLAEQMGLTQALISSYESSRLRLHAEMLARFALALKVSSDVLLGLKSYGQKDGQTFSLKLIRRMKKIAGLPLSQQKVLLHTIDNFLKGASK